MKKYRFVFACALLAALIFGMSGCKKEVSSMYKTMVISGSNDEVGTKQEWDGWNGEYFEKAKLKGETRTVTFGNKQYVGTYVNSCIDVRDPYVTDFYLTEKGGVDFGLREDTGELVYINFMTKSFFATEPYLDDVEDPKGTAMAVAKKIAAEYVRDIEEYEAMELYSQESTHEKDGKTYAISYHTISFVKKVGGYLTSDRINVRVSSKGNLASVNINDLNALDNWTVDFDKERVQESISNKIYDMYNTEYQEVVSFDIEKQEIAVTPDGDLCLLSMLEVNLKNTGMGEYSTGVVVITIIGEK